MNGHLRAAVIRLRGRWDVWLVAGAVPGLAALGFVQGYGDIPHHYGWDPSRPIPPEVVAAMDAERATYAFPDSLLRLIGGAPWLLAGVFFLTSLTLGLEFGWGTIRTVLLASPDRRRFLVSRLLALATVGLAVFAGLLVLGLVLPEVLAVSGAHLPPSPEVVAVEVLGAIVAWIVALAFVIGFLVIIPIGGADMPVVISLLNAFTGTAVAMAGFVIQNWALIIAGALVGASGGILTKLMADAMNRSLRNIMIGGFGTGDSGAVAVAGPGGDVRSIAADDAAIQLAYAQKVIIVPGYGLAAAQAQHQVAELASLLEERGIEVSYAIHPVAGRMPGHMNVLLAEANVPYPLLKEMDEINPEFPRADVALVIGANDVTNPAARRPGTAISGMPILDVDHAKSIIVIKRSMASGYAGIDNELYVDPKTSMFFADAKSALTELTAAVKTLVA